MKNIFDAPFIKEITALTSNMYRLGWDERNGGNISYYIPDEEAEKYLDLTHTVRYYPMTFDASELAGRIYVVTGSGKYFRNTEADPENNLGVVRVAADGRGVELLWGLADGSNPTSELAAHFKTHIARLRSDPGQRVVMHTHATNTVAMTFIHPLDEREFTLTLWRICTECIIVFPEGVALLPWMVCGNDEIGTATAEKMLGHRIVVWGMHGIFGAGATLDEAFGLIETVEKAAEIYMKIAEHEVLQTITDAQLIRLAKAFGVTPHPGYLPD